MTVGSGTLNKTISAQGKVSIPGMLQLSFTKDGVVNQIFKQEKDQVKAGDIIAQLDTTQAQISLQQAQTNLELAKTKLSELLLGPDASATTQLSNDIDQSKLSLDTIDVQLDAIQTEKQ
jgi:HlyD family secretion protein